VSWRYLDSGGIGGVEEEPAGLLGFLVVGEDGKYLLDGVATEKVAVVTMPTRPASRPVRAVAFVPPIMWAGRPQHVRAGVTVFAAGLDAPSWIVSTHHRLDFESRVVCHEISLADDA
jgi:hypothetical protein